MSKTADAANIAESFALGFQTGANGGRCYRPPAGIDLLAHAYGWLDGKAYRDAQPEQLALFQLSEPVQLHLFDTTASHATH